MHDTDHIKHILRFIVGALNSDEKRVLNDQIEHIIEAQGPLTMISLSTSSALRVARPDGPLAIRTLVLDNGNPTGELLIWVSDGIVGTLEYAWWTDDAPHELPETASLRIA